MNHPGRQHESVSSPSRRGEDGWPPGPEGTSCLTFYAGHGTSSPGRAKYCSNVLFQNTGSIPCEVRNGYGTEGFHIPAVTGTS